MSRRPTRFVPKDSSRRKVWVYVAVAAFVLADILLIVYALSANGAEDTRSLDSANRPPVVEPVETTSPETPTPTANASTAILPLPSTRILTALDGSTAWRATTGDCPTTDALLELTTDVGATWSLTDATGPTQVTAVQRILVTSESTVSLVGLAEADCSPQFVKTFVSGDNYSSYPELLVDTWYVDPADRDTVHSPAGDLKAPCASVVTVAPRDSDAAAVLCANGHAATTSDAGATWSTPVAVPGVIALTDTADGYLAAAIGSPDCPGVQLHTLTDSLSSTPTGCYETPLVEPAETPTTILPGNVALSHTDDAVWLWAGPSFAVSEDDGTTWQEH